jgi:MFS family permease
MACVISLALIASTIPSSLYSSYQALWSLSPLLLTLVYASYAFAVLGTLLVAGPVSDHVGRRPVLLIALASLMAALVMFMLADSVEWLFVARVVQGIATALAVSSASAGLLDLHPRRDADAVGLHNGTASNLGGALGVLIAAAILELLPAPRILPYAASFVLFAIAFVCTLAIAEPVPNPAGLRLRPQRPGLPREVRPAFFLAALGVLASWSIAGVSLALGPELLASLFHSSDAFVDGLSIVVLNGAAVVSQLAFRRIEPWAGAVIGSVALATGLLGIVVATAAGSGLMNVIATAVTGLGFGAAYGGALRALSRAIPADSRSSVMSAFYLVAYGALSIPAILAGILTIQLGLEVTFEILGGVFAAIALILAAFAWRVRTTARIPTIPAPHAERFAPMDRA